MRTSKSEKTDALQIKAAAVDRAFARAYPDVNCALEFENPFECLVSTILSAQTTDSKVNSVTPALFAKYPDARALACAKPEEIEPLIRVVGLYRTKAKNLVGAAGIIQNVYGEVIPGTIEELVKLPGVGRKTANCVILNAYGRPGIMCDTHFCRITGRIGLHHLKDPDKIEIAIARLLPSRCWGAFSHRSIHHGRVRCHARQPDCPGCPVWKFCAFVLEKPDRGV